jgi:hypothetical protein
MSAQIREGQENLELAVSECKLSLLGNLMLN